MIAWCLFQDSSYWNHFKRCLVAQLAVANGEKKGILGLQVPKSSFGTVPCRHFIQFSYATSSKGAIVPCHCLLMLQKRACLKIKDDLIQCFTRYPLYKIHNLHGHLRHTQMPESKAHMVCWDRICWTTHQQPWIHHFRIPSPMVLPHRNEMRHSNAQVRYQSFRFALALQVLLIFHRVQHEICAASYPQNRREASMAWPIPRIRPGNLRPH